MEYEFIENTGTRVAVNGRSFIGSATYQTMQSEMEFEIHNLEQIAYGAVLRAFKAQSDALTWEKEGLITELRKELRVSDDEHRELLSEVNADDLIRRIREWREAGGIRNVPPHLAPQHVNSQLPSPTVSASRRKQKAFLPAHPLGAPSQSLHPHSMSATTQQLSSAGRWGSTPGVGGRRAYAGQPGHSAARPVQHQYGDHASGAPMDVPSEGTRDPLIGRKVMIRWPADKNFYEAVLTDYNPLDGRHSLVYDYGTPHATLEWVNMKEVPPEDIRWVGDDPVISRQAEPGLPYPGRGRTSLINQLGDGVQPSGNGAREDELGEIEIYHTDTLIKKVEKVLDASHPDEVEIDKAKKLLKEHEQTLIQVIAKLANACDTDDVGEDMHGQAAEREDNNLEAS